MTSAALPVDHARGSWPQHTLPPCQHQWVYSCEGCYDPSCCTPTESRCIKCGVDEFENEPQRKV